MQRRGMEVVEKVEAGRREGVVVDEVEVKERAKEEGSRGRNTLAQRTKKIRNHNQIQLIPGTS